MERTALKGVKERAIAGSLTRGLKPLLMMSISIMLGLVGAELALRGYTLIGDVLGHRLLHLDSYRNPATIPIEAYGKYGFRQKPNKTFPYSNGTSAHSNEKGYRGPVVDDSKPRGTFRIILLGGSTTHGFGVNDDQTIDAHLRRVLGKRFPGIQIEVVNLAYDGYDSYQLYLRMQSDGIRLGPDLVIVNSGINDVRNAHIQDLKYPDPRTDGWLEVLASIEEENANGPSVRVLATRYSYLLRLPAITNNIYRERQIIKRQRELVRPNTQAIDNFEKNLRGIAMLTKGIGAGLIFSTPPSSLKSRYNPSATSTISYWVVDAATTQAYRDSLAKRMRHIASEVRARGQRAVYMSHELHPELFLDDCHLTSDGNLAVARNLADAAVPFVGSTFPARFSSAFSTGMGTTSAIGSVCRLDSSFEKSRPAVTRNR